MPETAIKHGAHAPLHTAPGVYAGDVTPQEAWSHLIADSGSMLVDVRTEAEWQFIGLPDMRSAKGKLATVSWKLYPHFALNNGFSAQLKEAGATPDMALFFLCRSGGRSTDAAISMTAEGYTKCYNISGGFEGGQDAHGHRGTVEGWKAARLPWAQA